MGDKIINAPNGKFIVFEGIDGSGKSSLSKMFAKYLELNGLPVVYTREPNGEFRDFIFNKLQPGGCDTANVLAFLSNRALHVHKVIKPALREGKLVICDRWDASTFANSDDVPNMNPLFRDQLLYDYSAYGLKPDYYIYCDVDPLVSYQRIEKRNPDDRTTLVELKDQTLRYDAFFGNRHNVVKINAKMPLPQCIAQIINWFTREVMLQPSKTENLLNLLLVDWWKHTDLEYVI